MARYGRIDDDWGWLLCTLSPIIMVENVFFETDSLPLKIGLPNRKVLFQPSIFRCYVGFREGNNYWRGPIVYFHDYGRKRINTYGCFQKYEYPKMDGLQWKTLLKWMIWGGKPTIFGNIRIPTSLYVLLFFFFWGGVLLKYDQHTKFPSHRPGGKIPEIFRDPQ